MHLAKPILVTGAVKLVVIIKYIISFHITPGLRRALKKLRLKNDL